MAVIPYDAVRFRCRGCNEDFRPNGINPHQGRRSRCHEAGFDVVTVEGYEPLAAEVANGSETVPNPGGAAGETVPETALNPGGAAGETVPDASKNGSKRGTGTGGGKADGQTRPMAALWFGGASWYKESVTPTVEMLTAYDWWRREGGFEGTFNEWMLQCVADYHYMCGLDVGMLFRRWAQLKREDGDGR